MTNDEERRALPSELAARSNGEDQAILAYLHFLTGTFATMEPLIRVELPMALIGTDADRLAWGLKAGPICDAVSNAVDEQAEPRPRCTLLRFDYIDALLFYGFLADAWTESAGVHTLDAHSGMTKGAANWEKTVGEIHRLRVRLAPA